MTVSDKKVNIFGVRFCIRSWWEFVVLYFGTYILREYRMKYPKDDPVILDCGAHLGTSAIWFRRNYQRAKITSFEPDWDNYRLLKKNLKINEINDVKVVNAGLSDKEGKAQMYSRRANKDSWGKTILDSWHVGDKKVVTSVKTVKLSNYIKSRVDLIKMDIEGAEGVVLKEIRDKLNNVREIIMEHHDISGGIKGNEYDEIIQILEKEGFLYKVRPGYTFGPRRLKLIHAWKE